MCVWLFFVFLWYLIVVLSGFGGLRVIKCLNIINSLINVLFYEIWFRFFIEFGFKISSMFVEG